MPGPRSQLRFGDTYSALRPVELDPNRLEFYRYAQVLSLIEGPSDRRHRFPDRQWMLALADAACWPWLVSCSVRRPGRRTAFRQRRHPPTQPHPRGASNVPMRWGCLVSMQGWPAGGGYEAACGSVALGVIAA